MWSLYWGSHWNTIRLPPDSTPDVWLLFFWGSSEILISWSPNTLTRLIYHIQQLFSHLHRDWVWDQTESITISHVSENLSNIRRRGMESMSDVDRGILTTLTPIIFPFQTSSVNDAALQIWTVLRAAVGAVWFRGRRPSEQDVSRGCTICCHWQTRTTEWPGLLHVRPPRPNRDEHESLRFRIRTGVLELFLRVWHHWI